MGKIGQWLGLGWGAGRVQIPRLVAGQCLTTEGIRRPWARRAPGQPQHLDARTRVEVAQPLVLPMQVPRPHPQRFQCDQFVEGAQVWVIFRKSWEHGPKSFKIKTDKVPGPLRLQRGAVSCLDTSPHPQPHTALLQDSVLSDIADMLPLPWDWGPAHLGAP